MVKLETGNRGIAGIVFVFQRSFSTRRNRSEERGNFFANPSPSSAGRMASAADRLEDDPLSHTWGSKRRPGLNQERNLKTQGNGIFHSLDIGGMLEGGDMMAELRVCWES